VRQPASCGRQHSRPTFASFADHAFLLRWRGLPRLPPRDAKPVSNGRATLFYFGSNINVYKITANGRIFACSVYRNPTRWVGGPGALGFNFENFWAESLFPTNINIVE
jgi:hypothetical protein